jgi:hypothetical protein
MNPIDSFGRQVPCCICGQFIDTSGVSPGSSFACPHCGAPLVLGPAPAAADSPAPAIPWGKILLGVVGLGVLAAAAKSVLTDSPEEALEKAQWRRLATREEWDRAVLDHAGPAVYELAIAGSRGGRLTTKYVGETGDADRRMAEYGRHGSHLREVIGEVLSEGWVLHYRLVRLPSKEAAVQFEAVMLEKYNYPWNRRPGRRG